MTLSDAYHSRVMALGIDSLEQEARYLEHDTGREFVQAAIKRLREELRIYDKRATKAEKANAA